MMDRISICEALAKRNEIDPFLKQMMTGDEKWVTFDNIMRKRSWSKRGQTARTVAKPQLTARKESCCVLPDNARPHTSIVTRQKLRDLGWEVFMHPPYSLDLALSDYQVFLVLQNFLSDKKLASRKDCENRLLDFFVNKNQDFYNRGIMKLPLKWQQIIEQNGAYLTQIGQSETC
nr:histone-lysine N-methyltransferase SETMAR-like [Nomia melanderi]